MTAHPARQTPAAQIEELQVEISVAIRQLRDQAPLLAELTDSHQRGLSFLTYDGRRYLDELARIERHLRIANARDGHPAPAAATPTPGNLAGVALEAELWAVLHHQTRKIRRALLAHGICLISPRPLPAEPTISDTLSNLRHLAFHAPSPKLLTGVRDELEDLVDRVTVFVENSRPGLLPDPCPFCGHHTLVQYPAEDLIRCDRDPKTGIHHPCICPDPTCPCHVGDEHRHEWRRPSTFGHYSWRDGLARLIAHQKNTKETTMEPLTIGVNTADRDTAQRLLAGYFTHLEKAGAIAPGLPTSDVGVDAMRGALAALVPAEGEAQHHRIVLEFEPGEGITVTFECTAPVASDCRMMPCCMADPDGSCYGRDGCHAPECAEDSPARTLVDGGCCLVKDWIDIHPKLMGAGKLTIPVTTEWTGGEYAFTPLGAESAR